MRSSTLKETSLWSGLPTPLSISTRSISCPLVILLQSIPRNKHLLLMHNVSVLVNYMFFWLGFFWYLESDTFLCQMGSLWILNSNSPTSLTPQSTLPLMTFCKFENCPARNLCVIGPSIARPISDPVRCLFFKFYPMQADSNEKARHLHAIEATLITGCLTVRRESMVGDEACSEDKKWNTQVGSRRAPRLLVDI